MKTLARYLDEHSRELLSIVGRLVQVPTINPPGEDYDRMTRLLMQEMTAVGLRTKRFTPSLSFQKKVLGPTHKGFPRYNVLGRWPVRGAKRTIHFNAHYDVVPVSGIWRHETPFSGQVAGGWIFGRGTADMKGSMASLLLALQALRATQTAPRMNVEVSFTADEETDSVLGSEWLVKHAPISPDYAVVMEGGDGSSVCCGHNGVVWLEVVIHGKAAHGSRPETGINALEKMAALVLSLEEHKKELSGRRFVAPDGRVMVPTLNLGGVFSSGPGGKINTVPAEARFSIDRRVLANETAVAAEAELRAFLKAAAKKIPQCVITVNKVSENHPCYSSPEDPFFGAMAAAVSGVRQKPATFSVSTGFNDMHFFSHYLKIPTLGYGPGGESMHGVNERAKVSDLVSTAKIYANLLATFDGQG